MKVTAVKNIIKNITFGEVKDNNDFGKNEKINTNNTNLNFEKNLTSDVVEISTKVNKKNLFQRVVNYYRKSQENIETIPYSIHLPYYLA